MNEMRLFRHRLAWASVWNASQFGVPQIRKRACIVALHEDLGITEFDFPQGDYDAIDAGNDSHKKVKAEHRFISGSEAIGDLPALKPGQSVDGHQYPTPSESDYQSDRRTGSIAIFNHNARSHSKEFLKRISPIRPGKGNADLPDGERFSDNYQLTRDSTRKASVSPSRPTSEIRVRDALRTTGTSDQSPCVKPHASNRSMTALFFMVTNQIKSGTSETPPHRVCRKHSPLILGILSA